MSRHRARRECRNSGTAASDLKDVRSHPATRRTTHDRRAVRRCALFLVPALTLLLLGDTQPAIADTTTLPDLAMAPLADLTVDNTPDGRALLRFSATIVNVGAGRFELVASRPVVSSDFEVSQRIYDVDGSWVDRPVSAELVFGGDGHNHWHVRNLETYELARSDGDGEHSTGAKMGFCFSDDVTYRLSLPGAPMSARYRRSQCGTRSSVALTMGLSTGWGDRYRYTLPDQYVDVTDLPDGKYRLRATADGSDWFEEADDDNNRTWVDLILSRQDGRTSAEVVGSAESA
jgi:lysyl oxidase